MSDLVILEKIVTIIAGFATAGGLIFVGYQTRLLRNERNLTLRAWVGIGEPHWVVFGCLDNDGNFISREKFENLSKEEQKKFHLLQRYIEIKNYGQLPAENLKARMKIISGYVPTKKDLEDTNFGSMSTMMPSSVMKIFVTFTRPEETVIANPEGELYAIWEIEYESPTGVIRKYGEITRFTQKLFVPIKSWNEKTIFAIK